MKLLSFFKLTYLLPSSIFLIICILISFLINLTYLNAFTSDEHFNDINKKSVKKDWILISSIQELLYHRIQTVFDYLITSKLYLDKFNSNYTDEDPDKKKENFANGHLFNLKNYRIGNDIDNEKDYLDKMIFIIDDSDNYKISFDNALPPKLKLQYKYLFLYSTLIPIFKSFYLNFERKDGFSLDSLYIMNRKTETFALYPVKHHSNYADIFNFFNMESIANPTKNPNNCRNKARKIPEYFYAFCRDSFKNIEKIYKENNTRTMFITSPYQNVFHNETGSNYVISICHIFNFTTPDTEKINDDYYLKFLNDEIVICADIKVNDYFKIFMNYEEQLSGYFYITRTNTKLPLFFPGMNEDTYPNDITRFEFNFSYYQFATTDVVNFNTYILPSLIKEYNAVNDLVLPGNNNLLYYSVQNNENSFKKGNLELNYYIYPIYFNNGTSQEHIISIIYVIDKNIYKNQLNILSFKLNQIIYLSLIITIIISIIISYIIHYIIYIFSMNITKPIKVKLTQNEIINKKKNINYTYQGIDINKLISLGLILKKAKKNKVKCEQEEEDSISDFDRNSNDIFGRFIYGNEILLKKNKEKDEESENLLENENENSKEEEEDESEDEGILPVIIDSQFNDKVKLLYDLNKVRSFMRGEQLNLKGNTITKFISCQNVFNEMKDKLGENMCLSNVGNLENLNNKYDKSIIFFSKSLNIENNSEEIKSKDILNIIDKLFDKEQKKKIFYKENNNINNSSNINNTLTNLKVGTKKEEKSKKKKQKEKIFDELKDMDDTQFHRFIKLFYAYNKYFSNVKTIENILNKTLHMTKTNSDEESYVYNYVKSALTFFNDYFILDIPKVHKNYKSAILICLKRLIESKNISKKKEKILYCYIELFHYYIAYLKIFIKRIINYINKYNNEDEVEGKNKTKTIDEIQQNKENIFNKVVSMAKKSQEYITKMKSKIGVSQNVISEAEKLKYKEFLGELQKIEEKNLNIEFNIFLIEQKYYYFFAKFSKLCGDYSTAIIYYLKVIDEKRLISNGLLNLKANKKICNIINFARYNPSFLSINEKDEKKINEIYEKCLKQLKELNKVDYKDIIIVLDKNYTNKDVERVYKLHMQQYKAISDIFENYISTNDRFGLYSYGDENFNYDEEGDEDMFINFIRNSSVKKLVGLSYKKNDNYGFIKGIIEKFHENIINDYENQSKMKQMYLNMEQKNLSFNMEGSIMKEKNSEIDDFYIYKKKLKSTINIIFKVINEANSIEEQRKKYVIFITESFKDELSAEGNNDKFNAKELFKDINYISKPKIEKLYIIGSLLDEKNLYNEMSNELTNHGIKNEYLEFENISELNKKFQTIGTLPRKYEYFNEKL